MVLIKKNFNNIFLALFCVILFFLMFKWIEFLFTNKYIAECFTTAPFAQDTSASNSYSVDLPLTTKYSCQNFCSPSSRCSITGQQCTADIDCPGCQPYVPPLPKSNEEIPGNNDAGKLTGGVTPQYSSLTNGYGTKERVVTNNLYSKPAMPSFGVNEWYPQFKEENELFDKRYKPPQLENMPNYAGRYSLTGQFVEDGPFPSNAELY